METISVVEQLFGQVDIVSQATFLILSQTSLTDPTIYAN